MSLEEVIKHAQGCYSDPPTSETATCDWIILPLLHASGYLPRDIVPQLKDANKKFPDYTVLPGKPGTWFLEAKAWHVPLEDNQITQALNYANHNGKRWSVLSNGKLWRLYDNSIQGLAGEKLVAEVSLEDTEGIIELLKALSRDSVMAGQLSDFACVKLTAKRVRERTSLIHHYLSEQVTAPDSSLVRAIVSVAMSDLKMEDLKATEIVQFFINRPEGTESDPEPAQTSLDEPEADFRRRVSRLVFELVTTSPGLIMDRDTGLRIMFMPTSWRSLPRVETVWSSLGSLVLIWVGVRQDRVKLRVEIGPGDQRLRQKMFNLAKERGDLFSVGGRKLSPEYCRIYGMELVKITEFATANYDIVENSLKANWARFVAEELPKLEKSVIAALS